MYVDTVNMYVDTVNTPGQQKEREMLGCQTLLTLPVQPTRVPGTATTLSTYRWLFGA